MPVANNAAKSGQEPERPQCHGSMSQRHAPALPPARNPTNLHGPMLLNSPRQYTHCTEIGTFALVSGGYICLLVEFPTPTYRLWPYTRRVRLPLVVYGLAYLCRYRNP